MTGRDRLIRLLKGEQVDRVPVAPFIFNNFIHEFYHSQDADPVEKGIELYRHFGLDIILRTCNVGGYLNETFCDSKNWRVTESRQGEGRGWNVTTVIRTPEKELTQVTGYSRITENETVTAVKEFYIKDDTDFEQFIKYQPPVPVYDCSVIRKARELLGEDGIAAPWAQGAFNSVSFYRNLEDLIMDPFTDPAFYQQMIVYFSRRMVETIRQFAASGADMICCGGNVGNATMVGPKFFHRYILPYEIAFTKKVKDLGLFYLYHNCGDAKALLDSYSSIGMDVYESLTPPPFGDTLLDEALEKISPGITLCGNIDQIEFLKTSSEEEIRRKVAQVLEKAKVRGNFILGTTDYFSEGTPHQNIRAFAEAGIEFGRY